jgi:putative addiction module component (TIGR02574 family)
MLRDTLAKLLELPATERVDIAMALWDSLTPAEQGAECDLTPEQRAELDRRLASSSEERDSAVVLAERLRRKSTRCLPVSSRLLSRSLASTARRAARSFGAFRTRSISAMSDEIVILGVIHSRRHPRRWQSRR